MNPQHALSAQLDLWHGEKQHQNVLHVTPLMESTQTLLDLQAASSALPNLFHQVRAALIQTNLKHSIKNVFQWQAKGTVYAMFHLTSQRGWVADPPTLNTVRMLLWLFLS